MERKHHWHKREPKDETDSDQLELPFDKTDRD